MENVNTKLKFGIEDINKFKFYNCKDCFLALSWNIYIHNGIKSLFDSKTSSVHSCMSFIRTFNHFVHIVQYLKSLQMKVTHNRNICYETGTILMQKEVNNANE